MAEYEITPYVRAAMAEALIVATANHLMTGLMYEVWEIAKEVGRCSFETPWTASRNPFGCPERFAGRLPDTVTAGELRELLYGPLRAPQDALWAQEPSGRPPE